VSEQEGAEAFEQEIGAEAEIATVRFDSPMNAQETSDYIERRLGQMLDSQEQRARFDDVAFRYVIDGARGIPRVVNELAGDVLRRLENGESLPVRPRGERASSESEPRGPAPPPDESRWQVQPSESGDAPRSDRSLAGALLGARPRRDPHELDATGKLFPPGFLGSGRAPVSSPDAPLPGASGAASADANAVGRAVDGGLDVPSVQGGAIPSRTAPQGAAVATSSTRSKLWMAALMVTAVAGGYLAGRVDLVSTHSSPPMPPARSAEPIPPSAANPRDDRTVHFAASLPAAVAPSSPAAEPSSAPPDSTASSSVRGDEMRAAESRPRVEGAVAEPESRRPDQATVGVEVPLPVVVQAVPTPQPRAERIPVASDASARRRPPPEVPAPDSTADVGQSIADGSVTAIVVGARGVAKPGARAAAYVRVQVRLEPGSILTIDGQRVGVAPFSDLIMEPGPHTFVAELPDGLQIEQLIQVTADTGIVEF
jgi:hypothetical protein